MNGIANWDDLEDAVSAEIARLNQEYGVRSEQIVQELTQDLVKIRRQKRKQYPVQKFTKNLNIPALTWDLMLHNKTVILIPLKVVSDCISGTVKNSKILNFLLFRVNKVSQMHNNRL